MRLKTTLLLIFTLLLIHCSFMHSQNIAWGKVYNCPELYGSSFDDLLFSPLESSDFYGVGLRLKGDTSALVVARLNSNGDFCMRNNTPKSSRGNIRE